MCTEPLYALRLKNEFDLKFKRFGRRTPINVLCAVRDIGKDTDKLNYDRSKYDLIMVSCGQCMQCRLLRVKQRAVMCMCEQLEHNESSFITLTFGYPQTYSYYRHKKKCSHYISSKKSHFHEWSLDVETWQKFMKRLRNWFYNYQLSLHLFSIGRDDLVYSKGKNCLLVKSHIRIPKNERDELLKDFKPQKIRVMHCGEYGSKNTHRAHHHAILFGFQFPDLEPIYEKGQKYYTSKILSDLWPFGIHRIGKCEYNSCCYVARYVTKKINGNNQEDFYNGRKPEYITYSTKPVLGANYFIKNYKEIVNTQKIRVYTDKKYECSMPKSYDIILKKIDNDLYEKMKEDRVQNCLTDLDRLMKQERSIYSKLDSGEKIALATLSKLVRSYESEPELFTMSDLMKKAKAFGLSSKYFCNKKFTDIAIKYLRDKDYKSHKGRTSNDELHKKYREFEQERNRDINSKYSAKYIDLGFSDEFIQACVDRIKKRLNPFKVVKRGRSLKDIESINENAYIDENGKEYIYEI